MNRSTWKALFVETWLAETPPKFSSSKAGVLEAGPGAVVGMDVWNVVYCVYRSNIKRNRLYPSAMEMRMPGPL